MMKAVRGTQSETDCSIHLHEQGRYVGDTTLCSTFGLLHPRSTTSACETLHPQVSRFPEVYRNHRQLSTTRTCTIFSEISPQSLLPVSTALVWKDTRSDLLGTRMLVVVIHAFEAYAHGLA